MKALIVCPTFGHGGAERHAVTMGAAMRSRGTAVLAALPLFEGLRRLVADFEEVGVRTTDLRPAGPHQPHGRRLTAGSLHVAKLLRRFRPDVVHFSLPWPSAGFPELLTCASFGVPAVVVFHLVPDDPDGIDNRRILYAWARGRKQAWVAVSDHGGRVLERTFQMPAGGVHVIRNGISPAGANAAGSSTALVESEDRQLGSPTVLAVGRLDAQKGYVDLLKALSHLKAVNPSPRVLIAGEGPERATLEKLISSLALGDTVRLLGSVSNVPELLQRAELFVMPSLFEGTPLALLEAIAAGTPVIAARFGGVEEIVEDGVTGLLAPVDDPAALSERIGWALDHAPEMAAMAQEAQRRSGRFSAESMIDQTLQLMDQVAHRAPTPQAGAKR